MTQAERRATDRADTEQMERETAAAPAQPAQSQPSPADRLPLPDTVQPGKVNWPYAIVIAAIHALALLALWPWLFSWSGLIVMVLSVHLFGQGINLCYHRILAHKSAKLPKWLEHALVVLALCTLQDTPGRWVATHRYHHCHSDEQPDPHSPLVSFLWSHIGWLLVRNDANSISLYAKYAPDILRDRFYMSLEKSPAWVLIYPLHAIPFFVAGAAVGWAIGGSPLQLGLSWLVWGVLVRTVVVWHITWSVNSLTHMFGYTNYKSDDHSKNNWLVGILAVGEGWHNNHHHDPVSASNQHRWWEIDITYYYILLLKGLGLARDVIPPKHIRHAGRRAAVRTPARQALEAKPEPTRRTNAAVGESAVG
jgi:stearoyl-CoA desaturase (delta-9 desaturase)